MTTPTPRTDALDAELGVSDLRIGDAGRYRKLASQLERELAAAQERAEWFKGQVEMFQALATEGQQAIVERAQAAEARAEASERDAKRLDWLIDHGVDEGGGRGFEFRVYIPHDSECLRTAIDAAIAEGK